MEKLIDLSLTIETPFARKLFSVFQQPIERFLGIDDVNAHYSRFQDKQVVNRSKRSAFDTILETMDVRYSYDEILLHQIPASEPLVVVANHPFGGLEGLIIGAMISKIRSDVRIMGNYLLKQIQNLEEWIIPVNPFDNRKVSENYAGLKQSFLWLSQGGALVVFPAGEVASWNPKRQRITDPDWSHHVAALIRKTRATTLPVYFPGRNSTLFSMAGLLSPRLRTLLLPRELVNKGKQHIGVHIGKPLAWSFLKRKTSDKELVAYLRTTTEILQYQREERKWFSDGTASVFVRRHNHREPLIEPIAPDILRQEIQALPKEQLLITAEDHAVYIAVSDQIPHALREIGRLREQAFRAVREGTGRSLDLDRFDDHYRHLFMCNRKTGEIIGGYRLGLVDEILAAYGKKGLYTNTLFRLNRSFFDQAASMIEFGRSFVRIEYQKKHNSLITIWRGIGEFIRRNPGYRILFGLVSIRNDYRDFSKKLMAHFLMLHHSEPDWASRVKPRHPYRLWFGISENRDRRLAYPESIDEVSHWISQIEPDGKGIPVLLKHYLKLNGKVLGFNIDDKFSDVIDALIVVDLEKTHTRMCKRFIRATDA
ncbi:lysophospholipid acyltransferase family protein [Desulfatirhabdium butyrativorans]|uniref:lysophospholipid acyltransferase family protein n=1 Tax=Desulfatirhabdium butyrativorans TaxID=340467 RepID=UPI00040B9209|nr:GNAT family N-acyltransferase [Desulfatirhabdium butyrativorans]